MVIHALGDSLVTAYGDDEHNFIGGWGDHLGSFFDGENVSVNVYAQGGRSSRSFLNEGRFMDTGVFTTEQFPYGMGPAYDKINEGDYVLIQFCHNDDDSKGPKTYIDRTTPLGKPNDNGIYPTIVPIEEMKVDTRIFPEGYPENLRNAGFSQDEILENVKKYEEILPGYGDKYFSYDCGATFKGYLTFYITKIREKGAIPVLVTPPARQYFDEGRIVAVAGHHGGVDEFGEYPYVRAIKQVGQEQAVLVLDLFEYSKFLIESLGEDYACFIQSIVGLDGKTLGESRYDRCASWPEDYDAFWDNHNFSRVDNTHQNRLGSYIYAGELARLIKQQIPQLGKFVLNKSTKKMKYPLHIQEKIEWIRSENPLLNL